MDVNANKLYIFISTSMPSSSMKSYMEEAKIYDATLVLRGLVHQSFKQTLLVLKPFIEKYQISFIIDPLLYQTFDIKTVPAFVFVKEQENSMVFDKLCGHVTLTYALEQFVREGDLNKEAMFLLQQKRETS